MAAWFVLPPPVPAFFLIFWYGDAPRPFVEWLTTFILVPMVTALFAILSYALLRFGRACRKYADQEVHIDKSGETPC
jgi:membrane protein implicated in regulation of membrane protease activity